MALREELRTFAHDLADLADAITLPAFQQGVETRRKDDGTLVTATDVAVEQALRRAIAAAYPGHAVLGEEEGLAGTDNGSCWVIDPIDATANFARGNPVYATLIAAELDGVPIAAVVSAPALYARWDAVKDGPARRDGRPIAVSDTSKLAQAAVSLGGLNYFRRHGDGRLVERITDRTARQRGFGDFWQHCLVAEGSLDATVEGEVSHWDLSAIQCLIGAAGGRFTDFTGSVRPDGGTAVSSNGILHDELLAIINS